MAQQLRIAKVEKNDDPNEMGRVKVFLQPEDNRKKGNIDSDDVPWCFPLLPKMFYTVPKVGEYVLVMLAKPEDGESQRYYIGPIIGQLNDMNNAISEDNVAYQIGSNSVAGEAPSMSKDTDGTLPDNDDVSINGKKNTGIYLRPDDVCVHAGMKKHNGKKTVKNDRGTEGYIQVGYDTENDQSLTNVVSNYINLFGGGANKVVSSKSAKTLHDNRDISKFKDDLADIMSETEQAVYGNKLVNFLEKFLLAFMNHVHPIGCLPPITLGTPSTALTDYLVSTVENYDNLSFSDKMKMFNSKKNPYTINEDSQTALEKELLSEYIRLK